MDLRRAMLEDVQRVSPPYNTEQWPTYQSGRGLHHTCMLAKRSKRETHTERERERDNDRGCEYKGNDFDKLQRNPCRQCNAGAQCLDVLFHIQTPPVPSRESREHGSSSRMTLSHTTVLLDCPCSMHARANANPKPRGRSTTSSKQNGVRPAAACWVFLTRVPLQKNGVRAPKSCHLRTFPDRTGRCVECPESSAYGSASDEYVGLFVGGLLSKGGLG